MMEKRKALLVLAGGRAAPDVLSLFWVQPQLVRVITSEEGWPYEKAFVDIAQSLPNCRVDVIHDINAYDPEACEKACIDACRPYPDTEWDWTFTIGSAPKVTGIAAYEVAKQKGIPCWHIDTQHERLVSLVKKVEIDKGRFFRLTLDDYMKIQHRTWKLRGMPDSNYRDTVKKHATGDSFKAFCDQAEQYKIVVVTAEKLPDIGKILKKEATNPTYPRI